MAKAAKISTKIGLLNVAVSVVFLLATLLVLRLAIRAVVIREIDEALLHRRDEIIANITNGVLSIDVVNRRTGYEESVEVAPAASFDTTTTVGIKTLPEWPRHDHIVEFRVLHSGFRHQGNNYRITISRSMFEWEEVIESIFTWTALALLLLLAILAVVNRIVYGSVMTPFFGTLERLREVRDETSLDYEFPLTGLREIDELRAALNRMNGRLRESLTAQKHFLQNISHELVTPLAILRLHTDAILQHAEELPAEVVQSLGEMQSTVVRAVRLNDALMMLSRIENDGYADLSSVNIAHVVRAVVAEMALPAEARAIHLEFRCANTEATAHANADLMHVLVRNVVQNAVRYSAQGHRVLLDLRGTRQTPVLAVHNVGPAIPPHKLPLIFRRFERTHHGRHNESTGIGLAIVAAICKKYAIDIAVDSTESHGTTVTLRWGGISDEHTYTQQQPSGQPRCSTE